MLKRLMLLTFLLIFSATSFANIKFWDGDNIESRGLNGVNNMVFIVMKIRSCN